MSIKNNVTRKTKSTMPAYTRREWPLVGSLFDFMSDDGITFLLKLAQKSTISHFHLGTIPMVLLNQADYAQSVLIEHADVCT